jgi:uncharacterized protein (DUF2147 family)
LRRHCGEDAIFALSSRAATALQARRMAGLRAREGAVEELPRWRGMIVSSLIRGAIQMKLDSLFVPATRARARLSIPAAALALLSAPVGALGANHPGANDPRGVWLRPEGGEQFSFYDCGGLLCAKLISVKKAQDQKSIGTVILRGASKSGPNEWKGKLYNADDGKVYDGFITIESATELKLKGCLWGVLCGGETWVRVASATKARGKDAPAQDAETAK